MNGEVLAVLAHAGADVTLRTYRDGDERGLVDCYAAVFPVDDPIQRPQSDALWAWKFAVEPTGRREIVLAEHPTAGVIGAYPCVPLRGWLDGAEVRTSQIVDLMVRHAFRRVGPRPGLFVHLGRAFYDRYCGRGPDRQLFHYGWPVPAWRIGHRYLDYLNVRDWNMLAREIPVDPNALHPLPGDVEIVDVDRFGADADELFDAAKAASPLTLVKDARYLNWRYADHPERTYRRYACRERSTGRLRGIGVYAVADFLRPNTAFVTDLITAPGDDAALTALIGHAERLARHDETGALACVLSPVDPRFHALQRLGYALWDTRYFLVAATWGPDTVQLRDSWHFTMGDSDLI